MKIEKLRSIKIAELIHSGTGVLEAFETGINISEEDIAECEHTLSWRTHVYKNDGICDVLLLYEDILCILTKNGTEESNKIIIRLAA